MICANVLPRQHTRIPWGWKNATIDSAICGKETYVIEPKGDLQMPDLCSYFDWDMFIVEGEPSRAPLGTRNYKSIFTTATRLLGTERLLEEQPDLSGVASEFLKWNARLLEAWPHIYTFFLGDDIAGNNGLFMSPDVFRKWLLPHYKAMFALNPSIYHIFHSDGDISEILLDLKMIGADAISYEPVGRMKDVGDMWNGVDMLPVEDQAQTHPNSMALQR